MCAVNATLPWPFNFAKINTWPTPGFITLVASGGIINCFTEKQAHATPLVILLKLLLRWCKPAGVIYPCYEVVLHLQLTPVSESVSKRPILSGP